MNLAPIVLFVYKKYIPLQKVVDSLLLNPLSSSSDLFIFSDSARSIVDETQVFEVRRYIKTISGFKSVHIYEAEENMGLAKSIITGVSTIIDKYGKVIVLEDDLSVSSNFLDFMNAALDFYGSNHKIASISGFTTPIDGLNPKSVYFTKRSSSWGWATWKDRWDSVDWDVKDYPEFLSNRKEQSKFNEMGSDLTSLLKKQMSGKISSWAIRWTYFQFRKNLYSVHPVSSKVLNIGFLDDATHTTKVNESRFFTTLDVSCNSNFDFPILPYIDNSIIKQFTSRYTFWIRAWYKLKSFL